MLLEMLIGSESPKSQMHTLVRMAPKLCMSKSRRMIHGLTSGKATIMNTVKKTTWRCWTLMRSKIDSNILQMNPTMGPLDS